MRKLWEVVRLVLLAPLVVLVLVIMAVYHVGR